MRPNLSLRVTPLHVAFGVAEAFANFFQWPSQVPQLQFLSEVPFRFFIVIEPLPVSVLLMNISLK